MILELTEGNMPDTNNSISLSGRVTDGPEYSHTIYGEAFFKLVLTVQRLSGTEDKIPVTVSERLLGGIPVEHGMYFHVKGQIRSYNQQTEKGSRLIITVFAREFIPASADETDAFAYKNEVELFGYICKSVIYRTTPFLREIADVLLAVNRRYGKSDYLPCIAWGRNARYLQDMKVGIGMHVIGRLQSREYKKVFEDGTEEMRTAYEISCSAVEPFEPTLSD